MNITSVALGTTYILGALHALEPGHGKSFLMAYMIGEKMKLKSVFVMSLFMLLAHFGLLAVLFVIIKLVAEYTNSESILEYITTFAPFLVIGFGLYIIYHSISHKHHHHHKVKEDKKVKNPIMVGLIGGLIPCPTVFAPIVIALNADLKNVLLYLIIYIVGMGSVLLLFVLSIFLARGYVIEKLPNLRSKIDFELLSGILVVVIGIVYFILRLNSHSH